jgi:hypothetical protein
MGNKERTFRASVMGSMALVALSKMTLGESLQMVPRPEWHGLRHQAARHYHHGVALRSAERSQAVQVSVSQR